MVILNSNEQEYLLHAIEKGRAVAAPRDFFLWSQGALQALLPHRVLLCLELGDDGRVRAVECLHSVTLASVQSAALCDASGGPANAWLAAWRASHGQPLALEAGEFGHGLVHGAGDVAFALLGMPYAAGAREARLLQMLIPCMQQAQQGMALQQG
ncbi:hypothetical protein [Pseudoduganella sp. OTU4001]|uniref:hypothetical protein n=1 Tax=Pseudoduganella sp. OTU4001 TaxID=3043854 RepID=UPI00313E6399